MGRIGVMGLYRGEPCDDATRMVGVEASGLKGELEPIVLQESHAACLRIFEKVAPYNYQGSCKGWHPTTTKALAKGSVSSFET